MENMIVGKAWHLRKDASIIHKLMVQLCDFAPNAAGYAWYEFDTDSGRGRRLSPTSRNTYYQSAPLAAKEQFVYTYELGLRRVHWPTSRVDEIVLIDMDNYEMRDLWATREPGGIYYILQKRPIPESKVVETMLRHGSASAGSYEALGEVYVLKAESKSPIKITEFVVSTRAMDVDVSRNLLFAATVHGLVAIDLESGQTRTIMELKEIGAYVRGITLGGSGSLLIWWDKGYGYGGVSLVDANRQLHRISEEGYNASMSPDGNRIVFLTEDGVWLISGNNPPERVLQVIPVPTTPPPDNTCRVIWCQCGAHFAVNLHEKDDSTQGSAAFPWHLLVADALKKELEVYDISPFDYLWQSCQLESRRSRQG